MRTGTWICVVVAVMLIAGGCEKKSGPRVESDLCWAASQGDMQEVQSLLARGASVHTTDHQGRTPLHKAAEGGRIAVADLLIRCGACIDAADRNGWTPAMLAMIEGRRAMVEYLIEQGAAQNLCLASYLGDVGQVHVLLDGGADVNQKSPIGWTALFCATSGNERETAGLLLQAGADPNVVCTSISQRDGYVSETALHRAVSEGHSALVEVLIDAGADVDAWDDDGLTPLGSAVQDGQVEMVQLLLDKGVNPNVSSEYNYLCGGFPLGAAIDGGYIDIAEALLAVGAEAKVESESGWTLLHVAVTSDYWAGLDVAESMEYPGLTDSQEARSHHRAARHEVQDALATRVTGLLIAHGADVNARDKEGITPLHCAAYRRYKGAVELLLAKGADVKTRTLPDPESDDIIWERHLGFRQGPGVTPLHVATGGGGSDVVDLLIDHGARVNAADASGNTPLHYAALKAAGPVVDLLIARGADINARDSEGTTPLVVALRNGAVREAKALIAAGAERVPLKGHARTMRLEEPYERELFLHNALRTDRGMWSLADADFVDPNEFQRRRQWVELLLEYGVDPDEPDEEGNTSLHVAISCKDVQLVSLLVAYGADVNAKNLAGATPLHSAACSNLTEPISMLLAHGAGVNARDKDDDTPLHNAALRGHTKVVEWLLAHGADPNVRNSRGRTPLDEATRRGHSDIIQLLKAKPRNAGENEK